MRRIKAAGLVLGCFVLALPVLAAEAPGDTFTVVDFNGEVTVKEPDQDLFQNAEKGSSYAYGTEMKSGRKASALIRFSTKNTVRLLANTVVTIAKGVRHPKLVRVAMAEGSLEAKLDDYPDDHEFHVELPVGICGVAGTRFTVTHERTASGLGTITRIEVTEGELFFDGDIVSTHDDVLEAGSVLEFTLIRCPQRKYVFIPSIRVIGQDLTVAFGNNNTVTLQDGANVQAAMGNIPGDAPYTAIRVLEGRVLVGDEVLDPTDTASFIRGRDVVGDLNAEDYMNGAEWLCKRCAELIQEGLTDAIAEQIEALPEPEEPQVVAPLPPDVRGLPPLEDTPDSPGPP